MPSRTGQLSKGAHDTGRGWRRESSSESSVGLQTGFTHFILFSFPESQGDVGRAVTMVHTHPSMQNKGPVDSRSPPKWEGYSFCQWLQVNRALGSSWESAWVFWENQGLRNQLTSNPRWAEMHLPQE